MTIWFAVPTLVTVWLISSRVQGLAKNDAHDFDDNRPEAFPPEYRSGFGEEGIEALQAFVKEGGTLLALGDAGELAVSKFKLPIKNVVANLPTTEFWSPGSTLRMNVDNQNPLAYGMPKQALGLFLSGNDMYEVIPSEINHRIERVATYIEREFCKVAGCWVRNISLTRWQWFRLGMAKGK